MIVRYWHPLREVDILRRQMDQAFDELTRSTFGQVPAWSPAIELRDQGETFYLRVQLPGVEAKDIDVQVNRETVSIVAERYNAAKSDSAKSDSAKSDGAKSDGAKSDGAKSDQDGCDRSEFRYGTYKRNVTLSTEVQPDQVVAEYKDGILNLTLPKVAPAKNQFVKVRLTNDVGVDSADVDSTNADSATTEAE
jgi:HSP20 family protein